MTKKERIWSKEDYNAISQIKIPKGMEKHLTYREDFGIIYLLEYNTVGELKEELSKFDDKAELDHEYEGCYECRGEYDYTRIIGSLLQENSEAVCQRIFEYQEREYSKYMDKMDKKLKNIASVEAKEMETLKNLMEKYKDKI